MGTMLSKSCQKLTQSEQWDIFKKQKLKREDEESDSVLAFREFSIEDNLPTETKTMH